MAQYVGVQAYSDAVNAWTTSVKRMGPWAPAAVRRRLTAIQQAVK